MTQTHFWEDKMFTILSLSDCLATWFTSVSNKKNERPITPKEI